MTDRPLKGEQWWSRKIHAKVRKWKSPGLDYWGESIRNIQNEGAGSNLGVGSNDNECCVEPSLCGVRLMFSWGFGNNIS